MIRTIRAHSVAIAVTALMAALAIVMVAVLLVAVRLSVVGGDETVTRVGVLIVFLGETQDLFLLASLLAFWLGARRDGERSSALLAPMIAVKVSIAATLAISAVIGFDLLGHHLRPHWIDPRLSGVRAASDFFLLATVASLAWMHIVWLTLWGWTRRRILWLVLGLAVTTALTAAVALVVSAVGR